MLDLNLGEYLIKLIYGFYYVFLLDFRHKSKNVQFI